MSTHFNITLTDDEKVFLLNSGNEYEVLTILVKYFIYKSKFKDDVRSILTIPHFENYLKHKMTNQPIHIINLK